MSDARCTLSVHLFRNSLLFYRSCSCLPNEQKKHLARTKCSIHASNTSGHSVQPETSNYMRSAVSEFFFDQSPSHCTSSLWNLEKGRLSNVNMKEKLKLMQLLLLPKFQWTFANEADLSLNSKRNEHEHMQLNTFYVRCKVCMQKSRKKANWLLFSAPIPFNVS